MRPCTLCLFEAPNPELLTRDCQKITIFSWQTERNPSRMGAEGARCRSQPVRMGPSEQTLALRVKWLHAPWHNLIISLFIFFFK